MRVTIAPHPIIIPFILLRTAFQVSCEGGRGLVGSLIECEHGWKRRKTYSQDIDKGGLSRVLEAHQGEFHLLLPKQAAQPVQKLLHKSGHLFTSKNSPTRKERRIRLGGVFKESCRGKKAKEERRKKKEDEEPERLSRITEEKEGRRKDNGG